MVYPRRFPRAKRLKEDLETDVLVVGAGISGALIAYALASDGHRVAVIDRRGPVTGSTPASTSLLLYEIDIPLIHLKRKMGAHPAERAWLRSKAALDALYQLARREKIDAAMSLRPSVYLAGSVLDAHGLAKEARARERLGLPSRYLDRHALLLRFGLSRSAAIVSDDNVAADPRALASGFLRRAKQLGARLYAPHEIADIHSRKHTALAVTKDGFTIESREIVLCTGYEMPKIVPVEGHSIQSTWVIATKPQPERLWPEECFIWEAADPYLYVRATIDGRIICGGEDAEIADAGHRDALLDDKAKTLEKKLGRMLPKVDSAHSLPGRPPSVRAIPDYLVSVQSRVIRAAMPCWVMEGTESHIRCLPPSSFPRQTEEGKIPTPRSLHFEHNQACGSESAGFWKGRIVSHF